MSILERAFKSMPLSPPEGEKDYAHLPKRRTTPTMSVGLKDLAEGMAVSQDQVGLRRLQTFQHVKEALEQGLPSSELKPSGSIIGELAGRFKSFAGPTLATATTQRHSEEVRLTKHYSCLQSHIG